MTTRHRTIFGSAVSALLVTTTAVARAQLPTKGQAWAIGGGTVVGGAAAVGIAIYFAVQNGQSLRGCVVSAPGGVQFPSRSDQPAFTFTGELAATKPGDQVRVSGKKAEERGCRHADTPCRQGDKGLRCLQGSTCVRP